MNIRESIRAVQFDMTQARGVTVKRWRVSILQRDHPRHLVKDFFVYSTNRAGATLKALAEAKRLGYEGVTGTEITELN